MRYLLLLVASFVTFIASSQSTQPIAVGFVQNGQDHSFVEEPVTTIAVDISLQTTSFKAGVYARYAQKYLGERAPLTNKESTTVEGAQILLAPHDYIAPKEVKQQEVVVKSPAYELPIDRTSADITLPELAAQEAASRIFANRKVCQELISGDVGEGVFGAGLEVALDRFDRIESEYLSLFMGREVQSTQIERFYVDISSDMRRYMICRYDAQRGLISANELDGEPIYLQITPSQVQDTTVVTTMSKSAREVTYILPNRAQCDLYVGGEIISSKRLPLYSFGGRTTIIYDPK